MNRTTVKRILLIVVIPVMLFQGALAQLQRHDFNISMGLFSSSFFEAVDENILIDLENQYPISKDTDQQTGALFLIYRYYPTFRYTVGLTVGMERIKGNILLNSGSWGTHYSGFFVVAVESDCRYVTKRWLQLYSGGGIGVFFHDEINSICTYHETEESFNLATS
ncbi:MAG TPA: hypothetical protein VMW76_07465 [Bacteroidales bacterium]|nr:hypothetical protein [Bacteroidales bacterium]